MPTDVVMDHLRHPRNVGPLLCSDGRGHAVDADRRVSLTMELRVDRTGETVSEARFQCQSDNPMLTIAASVTADLIRGWHVDEAALVAPLHIQAALGSWPPEHRYCLELCAEAIHQAVIDYVHRSIARLTCETPPPATEFG